MSLVTTIFILVPVFAPSIGQIIISISNWKIIFVFMLFLSIILKLFIVFKYLEAGKIRDDLRFNSTLRGFVEVFNSKTSRTYTITAGLIFGILVSF